MPSLASLAVAALGGGLLASSADAAALRAAAPAAAPTMMNVSPEPRHHPHFAASQR
jgi:hypothetical protein